MSVAHPRDLSVLSWTWDMNVLDIFTFFTLLIYLYHIPLQQGLSRDLLLGCVASASSPRLGVSLSSTGLLRLSGNSLADLLFPLCGPTVR